MHDAHRTTDAGARPPRRAGRSAVGSGVLLLAFGLTACAEAAPSATSVPAGPPAGGTDPAPSSATLQPTGGLQDGEYTAKGWYGGGPSSIDVTVTLRDGEVEDVEVRPNAVNATSLDYQRRFASGIGELVVGRPLAEIGDVVVSGSSGTPAGYDDAVRQIAAEAGG